MYFDHILPSSLTSLRSTLFPTYSMLCILFSPNLVQFVTFVCLWMCGFQLEYGQSTRVNTFNEDGFSLFQKLSIANSSLDSSQLLLLVNILSKLLHGFLSHPLPWGSHTFLLSLTQWFLSFGRRSVFMEELLFQLLAFCLSFYYRASLGIVWTTRYSCTDFSP